MYFLKLFYLLLVSSNSLPDESEASSLFIFVFRPKYCKSCAGIENELTKITASYNNKISVVKVDNDEENVDNFDDFEKPTFMFFRNGVKIANYSGFDGEMLENKIKEIL